MQTTLTPPPQLFHSLLPYSLSTATSPPPPDAPPPSPTPQLLPLPQVSNPELRGRPALLYQSLVALGGPRGMIRPPAPRRALGGRVAFAPLARGCGAQRCLAAARGAADGIFRGGPRGQCHRRRAAAGCCRRSGLPAGGCRCHRPLIAQLSDSLPSPPACADLVAMVLSQNISVSLSIISLVGESQPYSSVGREGD